MNSLNKQGFWGERTATIDWCENNYEITYYIAEFWNTVSNLVMILFPLYSMYWSYNHIKFAQSLKKNSLNQINNQFVISKSIIFCQIGLMMVGIGSWMFHMTLMYPMQLLDELPMIYGSAVLIYANYDLWLQVIEFEEGKMPKSWHCRPLIATLISLYCFVVTVIYLSVWKNPVFHEIAYGAMVFMILIESLILIKKLKSSKTLYYTSLAYYAVGFLFWNMDNNFCSYLKSARGFLDTLFGLDGSNNAQSILFNIIVVFLKSIFEFHSLWHLFTGFAAYMTILFIIDLHYQLHLNKTNQPQSIKQTLKPVDTKFNKLYYHLTNKLIEHEKSY